VSQFEIRSTYACRAVGHRLHQRQGVRRQLLLRRWLLIGFQTISGAWLEERAAFSAAFCSPILFSRASPLCVHSSANF